MVAATTAVEITNTYPHRVLVSVTGIAVGDRVRVYRVVGGRMTAIRGGYLASAESSALVVTDAEMPFGVPVYWLTRINEQSSSFYDASSAPLNITHPGEMICISDAITGLSAQAIIAAWDKTSYQADSSVFRVGAKNLVVSGEGKRGQFSADVKLLFLALSSKENFESLVGNATSGILQLRRPVSDGSIEECYFHITNFDTERFSQDRKDDRRYVTMSIVETDPWPYLFKAKGFTLQDLADVYAGQTLSNLSLDFASLLNVAQADLSTT